MSGDLAIRGIQRPFTMTLIVSRDGAGFRAAGDGVVKLSTYGIDQPSQLGVRTRDDVKLHLDFTARPADLTARLGGSRTLPRAKYQAARVAHELDILLTKPEHAQRARETGEQIRMEKGASVACDLIEQMFGDETIVTEQRAEEPVYAACD